MGDDWGAILVAGLGAVDALIGLDGQGTIIAWDGRAAAMFGAGSDVAVGRDLVDLAAETDRAAVAAVVGAAGDGVERVMAEMVRADGSLFAAVITVCPGDHGALVVVQDLAGDPELPTQLIDEDVLLQLLDDAYLRQRDDLALAVLRIDVPSAGGAGMEGDAAWFAEVATALCDAAGRNGTVAASREGGFTMLLDDIAAPHVAINVADRVAETLRGAGLAGIGIGFGADAGVSAGADVLDHAEDALAVARDAGDGRSHVFDPAVRREIDERRRVRDELYDSIDAGHFVVHYQPAFRLGSNRVPMVEALVRWEHPTRGLVAAGEFIQLAEEHDLILPLGAWVLNEACRQLGEWTEQFGADTPSLAINFAATQLFHPAAIAQVIGVVSANDLDPSQLSIELAEPTLLVDVDRASERLHELAATGVSLSIDHAGADPDIVHHLAAFPVSVVKIDRSVVNALADDEAARALAAAIAEVGRAHGAAVAADGVETEEQMASIATLGLEQAQGYLLGRPQPATAIAELVAKGLNET